jgi:hypothetical protein
VRSITSPNGTDVPRPPPRDTERQGRPGVVPSGTLKRMTPGGPLRSARTGDGGSTSVPPVQKFSQERAPQHKPGWGIITTNSL